MNFFVSLLCCVVVVLLLVCAVPPTDIFGADSLFNRFEVQDRERGKNNNNNNNMRQSLSAASLICLLTAPFLALAQNTPTNAPGTGAGTPGAEAATNSPGTGTDATTTTGAPVAEGWQGCVDPNGGFQPVTIGEPTTVCLVLASSPDWGTEMRYLRLNFQPIADEYSRFHVPNSYQQLVASTDNGLSTTFPGNITVHASSQTS